jgi:hypothetical protein
MSDPADENLATDNARKISAGVAVGIQNFLQQHDPNSLDTHQTGFRTFLAFYELEERTQFLLISFNKENIEAIIALAIDQILIFELDCELAEIWAPCYLIRALSGPKHVSRQILSICVTFVEINDGFGVRVTGDFRYELTVFVITFPQAFV